MQTKMISLNPKPIVLFTIEGAIGNSLVQAVQKIPTLNIAGVFFSTRIYKRSDALLSAWPILAQSGLSYAWYLLHASNPAFCPPALQIHPEQAAFPIVRTADVNQGAAFEQLVNLKPELILSCYFNQLIKKPVLGLPAEVLNIHPGILPTCRGLEPVLQTLLRNPQHYGVTLHRVDETLDTGEILRQRFLPLPQTASLLELNINANNYGLGLLEDYLANGGKQNLGVTAENYYSWPSRSSVNKFKQKYRLW